MPSLAPRLYLLPALLLACSSKPPVDEDSATGTSTGSTSLPTTGDDTTASNPPTTTGTASTTDVSTSSTTTPPATTTGDPTTDPSTGDTTTGTPACDSDGQSNLPGVRICFPPQQQEFTLAEAGAGVEFKYDVIVDEDIPDVQPTPGDAGSCDEADPSGLFTLGRVTGGDEAYCVCDEGLCPCCDFPTITLEAGVYPGTFAWNGVNWGGPSDTDNPFGPPFPPGGYTVSITAEGVWSPGFATTFAVEGVLPITLVP
jgi:hypothetical protein